MSPQRCSFILGHATPDGQLTTYYCNWFWGSHVKRVRPTRRTVTCKSTTKGVQNEGIYGQACSKFLNPSLKFLTYQKTNSIFFFMSIPTKFNKRLSYKFPPEVHPQRVACPQCTQMCATGLFLCNRQIQRKQLQVIQIWNTLRSENTIERTQISTNIVQRRNPTP